MIGVRKFVPAESHKCDTQLQISFLQSPAYGKSTWKMLLWLSLKLQAVRGILSKTVCTLFKVNNVFSLGPRQIACTVGFMLKLILFRDFSAKQMPSVKH